MENRDAARLAVAIERWANMSNEGTGKNVLLLGKIRDSEQINSLIAQLSRVYTDWRFKYRTEKKTVTIDSAADEKGHVDQITATYWTYVVDYEPFMANKA
jgi:hypothetical protein